MRVCSKDSHQAVLNREEMGYRHYGLAASHGRGEEAADCAGRYLDVDEMRGARTNDDYSDGCFAAGMHLHLHPCPHSPLIRPPYQASGLVRRMQFFESAEYPYQR